MAWKLTNSKDEIIEIFKTDDEKLEYARKLLKENNNLKLLEKNNNIRIGGRPSIHQDIKKQVHELRIKGLSFDKIAKELKISKGSVFNILKTK